MRRIAKKAMKPAIDFVKERVVRDSVGSALREAIASNQEIFCQQIQRNIVNQYMLFKQNKIVPYNNIQDAGFRVYYQFEEDGIILYVLSMIGFRTKRVVEMCCGSGDECMSTNLILNHGFDGYLFDGNQDNIARADTFFRSKKDCLLYPPVLTQSWITIENVNELLIRSGCAGEVDLFSLDIDGNTIGFGMRSTLLTRDCWFLRRTISSHLTRALRLSIRQILTVGARLVLNRTIGVYPYWRCRNSAKNAAIV